ncbi:hypothetical protein Vadar_026042 [Vaccinium darrowii]|uniref:Uncharacterized protein n=1 Tax=Vaccinium darrowii TaxID=229202 RepID=A0ACB7X3R9_9ERIC|nr:hypothetical protein Vadar_026042 [Vaccinium darrowii]
MFTSSFFFLLIPFATPLEFNLPSITPDFNNSINCTGDAYISINGIQLTPDPDVFSNTSSRQHKKGRATYFQPLHLWDGAPGNLTDFSTNFSFVIQGVNYGEGITFFLAPNGSNIPADSGGGGLGLVNENGTSTFVAVEFDTYRNTWEEGKFPINHVGININNMTSVVNEYWESGISDGRTNEARIKYDSSTKNLSVAFTDFENGVVFKNLSYVVDLSAHLPEWVTFGFSGSTGSSFEKNSIKSWEFSTSRFVIDEGGKEAVKGGNKTGLVVGLSVGLGKASKESDVYSFGVVALEIACGRRPIEPNAPQNEVKMVEWVWELYGNGRILEAVDRRLGSEFDENVMQCLMVVGLWCANPDWGRRPSIRQAMLVLNFEAPLPVLPEKIPMPMSFGPPGNSFGSYANSSFYGSGSSSQVQSSTYSGNSSVAKSLPSAPAAAVSFSSGVSVAKSLPSAPAAAVSFSSPLRNTN